MADDAPPGLTPKQASALSGALMRQHADLANTLAGVAGAAKTCPTPTCNLPPGHAPPCAGSGMGGGLIVAGHIVNHGTITFGSINGEPTFTLSAPEACILERFLTIGHREYFSEEEEEACERLTGRLHAFLVGLQEKEKPEP